MNLATLQQSVNLKRKLDGEDPIDWAIPLNDRRVSHVTVNYVVVRDAAIIDNVLLHEMIEEVGQKLLGEVLREHVGIYGGVDARVAVAFIADLNYVEVA